MAIRELNSLIQWSTGRVEIFIKQIPELNEIPGVLEGDRMYLRNRLPVYVALSGVLVHQKADAGR